MTKKTSAWTDEERAEMEAARHTANVEAGAYELGPDGRPIRFCLSACAWGAPHSGECSKDEEARR